MRPNTPTIPAATVALTMIGRDEADLMITTTMTMIGQDEADLMITTTMTIGQDEADPMITMTKIAAVVVMVEIPTTDLR